MRTTTASPTASSLLWLCACLLLGCGPKPGDAPERPRGEPAAACRALEQAVIRGVEVLPTEKMIFNATVAVESSEQSATCSGVLIDRRRVLTAAHCVTGGLGSSVTFFKHTCAETRRAVSRTAVMPGEPIEPEDIVVDHAPIREDAAILVPAEAAPEAATPIAVIDEPHVARGREVTVAGFGLDEGGTHGVLRKLTATVGYRSGIYPGLLVAADLQDQRAICGGDSGGPWFTARGEGDDLVVTGITSAGIRDAEGVCPPGATFFGVDLTSTAFREFLTAELARELPEGTSIANPRAED